MCERCCTGGDARDYERWRERTLTAIAERPTPSRNRIAGSGTTRFSPAVAVLGAIRTMSAAPIAALHVVHVKNLMRGAFIVSPDALAVLAYAKIR
jgi:hypothetical protein